MEIVQLMTATVINFILPGDLTVMLRINVIADERERQKKYSACHSSVLFHMQTIV